tara:strand:- start:234 stop:947 length:714 start_codon:yes stop_codon:yes gene_type:complete
MEEKKDRDESRFRMKAIANASDFFKELTGNYSVDGNEIFSLVEAAIDSLYADSLFTGSKKIFINNEIYKVEIEKGFDYRADTTFSEGEKIKRMVTDTLHTVLMIKDDINKEINLGALDRSTITGKDLDTLYVNESFLRRYKKDSSFYSILKTNYKDRIEVVTDYLRKKYHLNQEFLNCPLTGKPYLLELVDTESEDVTFAVTSPVDRKNDSASRYLFFKYDPGNHGYIKAGITSWAE